MTDNMLSCIRALAENRIDEAKKHAKCCCAEDSTKKNEDAVAYCKKLLENGTTKIFELPVNLKGLLNVIDVSDFRKNRYYLGNLQNEVFSDISRGCDVTTKMLELGIPYLNSTLIYGEPGTGKTEFAKYVAYKLGLPFAYVNFSYLISSYMGNTSKNLRAVFDYCKGQKCVLLLDEIDCIGLARGSGEGTDGELARTTISLMQCLDNIVDGQIVIGATNRADRLDKALLRRFHRKYEFEKFNESSRLKMIAMFLNDVGMEFDGRSVSDYAAEDYTQAEIQKHIVDCIVKAITENTKIIL